MKFITILTAAALGLTATASLAQQSTIVSFADLDLTTPAGHAMITRRISNAARKVCDIGGNGVSELATHVVARNCRLQAMADAMKAVEAKTALRYAAR